MTQETRTIAVPVYRDGDGKPTCCANIETAKCDYLATRRMGQTFVCSLGISVDVWDDNGVGSVIGYLRPHKDCPLWQGEGQ